MVQDISARKEAQAALAQAQEELLRHAQQLEERVAKRTAELSTALQELEAFSYSIAHDLRAPLRGIHGFGSILQREYGSKLAPGGEELIRLMNASAERMDHLIRDILSYSKIVRQEILLEPVNLDSLVRDIIQGYPNFHPDNADIEIQTPLPWVLGNVAALTQCLSNLLENAVKFVPPGVRPSIRIRAETRGSRTRISIQDNGVGIPEQSKDRLFRMFQRLHTEAEYPGTGIGLAIVRRSVERMAGTVGVESEVGKGSTFWIELNRADVPVREGTSLTE
jgi:signal transduction histidine kinase